MGKSVLIADDHPIVLGGLRALIDSDPDFHVVATAENGDEAAQKIAQFVPDLAVLDLNMPRQSGLEVLSRVGQAGLATQIVILAAAASDAQIHDIVGAGARGLLFKESAPRVLMDCLTAVVGGGVWLPPGTEQIVSRLEERSRAWQFRMRSLTGRELEVVRLVNSGCSNKEIAYTLQLSEGTVKVHLNNIFRKLNVSTRFELTSLARQTERGAEPSLIQERR
jgi:DNA-binding NarL/FixJ family response regulator